MSGLRVIEHVITFLLEELTNKPYHVTKDKSDMKNDNALLKLFLGQEKLEKSQNGQ